MNVILITTDRQRADGADFADRWDDLSYAGIRSDLYAQSRDVMNNEVNEQPMVGVVG